MALVSTAQLATVLNATPVNRYTFFSVSEGAALQVKLDGVEIHNIACPIGSNLQTFGIAMLLPSLTMDRCVLIGAHNDSVYGYRVYEGGAIGQFTEISGYAASNLATAAAVNLISDDLYSVLKSYTTGEDIGYFAFPSVSQAGAVTAALPYTYGDTEQIPNAYLSHFCPVYADCDRFFSITTNCAEAC